MKKKILVTCAFPYANGPIHIGHILEHIQADIWVRYKKMRGYEVWFICADDAHGTPIMLQSKKLKKDPEKFIISIYKEHVKDFLNFNISYDNYYSTHSPENNFFLKKIYNCLKDKGLIKTKVISQFFDRKENMFLPDRFVRGLCPVCFSEEQYGDHCEKCGRTYSSTELVSPKSVLSGIQPVLRDSLHFFFDLPHFSPMLKSWISSGVLENSIVNKVMEWFIHGLKEWDISRDGPYFGFNIPGFSDKYFYVWLDAPVGYISTFKNLCDKKDSLVFDEFWNADSKHELYHFIGKDIVYFHSLFWPAILEGSGFRKPTKIFVHGHVTINGSKISKSKGLMISADNWFKNLDSDSLRYYYFTKISSKVQDIEVNSDIFIQQFNTNVVNKIVNLASRISRFISFYFNCYLSKNLDNQILYDSFVNSTKKIEFFLEKCEFSSANLLIMKFANIANSYIDEKKPWVMAKNINDRDNLHNVCTTGINFFRILIIWLKSVMPDLAKKVEFFLNSKLTWNSIYIPLLDHKISIFKPLYKKIKRSQLDFLNIR
ncbi:methionine--tRNA ligase [Buchnera aphidicola (Schlechtendalia chinensis)]|uniref:Methionine--tRNA ligase n=1 Tax=Buchnera aphidicola subsp. Schlechtendalia chinensis TaxID=118110 RepID=A0A172WD71_BUCSC|nr:methionine--tRNA ligase [Buchnera aphidicola]ANF16916.1 methionine--tRNA ligase [Buchnera aphidicola (Schlechtendalia chinensis)]